MNDELAVLRYSTFNIRYSLFSEKQRSKADVIENLVGTKKNRAVHSAVFYSYLPARLFSVNTRLR